MSGSNGKEADTSSARNTGKEPVLVEIKKGKAVFKQKPISYDKLSETLAEIVKFRQMLEECVQKQMQPMTIIPDEYRPVIVKLGQESDKTLAGLSKYIQQQLVTPPEEETARSTASILPIAAVEATVQACMSRVNYGIDTTKASAALNVWRWEAQESYRDWLPKAAKEKADTRLAERHQAKTQVTALFEALPQAEKDAMLPKAATNARPGESTNRKALTTVPSQASPSAISEDVSAKPPNATSSDKSETENQRESATPKKATDPVKTAKDQERQEKKAAKILKEQKEQAAQSKSRSIMANFFVKPKAVAPAKAATSNNAVASTSQSDFRRTFKPFVVKKDTQVAPINRFANPHWKSRIRGSNSAEVIVIDDGTHIDLTNSQEPSEGPCSSLSREEPLRDFLRIMDIIPRRTIASHHKSYNPISVRDLVAQLTEAEVAGDISSVRELLAKLRDREAIPAKHLVFHTDARPGYLGTWSRSSLVIGPRTPLHKDLLEFDYGYDSGEDWEEEAAGDGDDLDNDDEEEEADAEDSDSDIDDFLVDDDEPVDLNSLMVQEDAPQISDLPFKSTKRKTDSGESKEPKKRKVVVPLVPFVKGPCLEEVIGEAANDILKPYQIQLFNDTPAMSIDPFTFVSTWNPERQRVASSTATAAVSVTPATQRSKTTPVGPVTQDTSVRKPTNASVKTSFPEAHLPFLYEKIGSSKAASLVFLVESIYQELKPHGVKKNAIEAKVREVGEKCKINRVWVVKPTLLPVATQ